MPTECFVAYQPRPVTSRPAATLAQALDHRGYRVERVVVPRSAEVGEASGDRETALVSASRPIASAAISTAHGKHEYRSRAATSSTSMLEAARAARGGGGDSR